jgi:hypothetical protein
MTFSFLIVVGQFYHALGIDSIRRTTLGGLVLRHGFLWSVMACYCAGVGLGALGESTLGHPCETS